MSEGTHLTALLRAALPACWQCGRRRIMPQGSHVVAYVSPPTANE